MPTTNLDQTKIPIELQLLLKLSVSEMNKEDEFGARRLLEELHQAIDWGRFLHLAARHRLLPLVGRNLIRHNIIHNSARKQLTPYRQVFASAYLGNRARNEKQHEEFGRILHALNGINQQYLVRKGPLLDVYGFRDLGARQSNDLDLLVERADIGRITPVLNNLGYRQGIFDSEGNVQPYSRRAQLYWRIHLNNSLPFVKLSGTFEVDYFRIDFCHSIVQQGSTVNVPNQSLFERSIAVEICGVSSRAMDEVHQLLDLCLHLHKEATALYYLESGKGFALRKLLDLVVHTQGWTDSRWESFAAIAMRSAASAPCFYALYLADQCFPGQIPHATLEALRPGDDNILDRYGDLDGESAIWQSSFFERLAEDRPAAVPASRVPRE